MTAYNHAFFTEQRDESVRAADRVVRIVADLLHPTSVLDVGSGVGAWVRAWQRAGVPDALGVDGDYVSPKLLLVESAHFKSADLAKPLDLRRRYGLVQSLEVAEHLDAALAGQFIDSLCRHGDVILFSAAIPGQGGTHHVNERWPSYWLPLFTERGFTAYDVLRERIWTDSVIPWYYRQNLLIYSRRPLEGLNPKEPLDLVHPEGWGALMRAEASGSAHLKGMVRALAKRTASSNAAGRTSAGLKAAKARMKFEGQH